MNKVLMKVGIAVVLTIVIGLILSLPVMWLWNGMLVPAIPVIKEVGWIQAWGIMILCQILIKGIEVKMDF